MNMKTILLTVAGLAAAFSLQAQDDAPTSKPTIEKKWTTIAAYPLDVCVVSGKAMKAPKAKTFEAGGRTFKTCCERCQAKVEKDPAKFAEKLDDAIAAAQLASYPMTTCPLSHKPLGDKAKNIVLDGTLVRVCCGKCAAKAKKAPEVGAKVVAQVEAARYAQQLASYKATTCPVSGEEIDPEDATDVLYGGQLVRFCCEDCIADFKKAPAKYLGKIAHESEDSKGSGAASDGNEGGQDCCDGSAAAGSCCGDKAGAASCHDDTKK